VEAACLAIRSIAAKNPATQAVVMKDRRIILKLFGKHYLSVHAYACIAYIHSWRYLHVRAELIALAAEKPGVDVAAGSEELDDSIHRESKRICLGVGVAAVPAVADFTPFDDITVSTTSVSKEVSTAAGAMWALCALLTKNPVLQVEVCGNEQVVRSVISFMCYEGIERAQSAAAWTLSLVASEVASVRTHLVQVWRLA
jgi:hypothetical protein